MQAYTIEDFNKFEKNAEGFTVCPSGDYRKIKEFSDRCRFGSDCMFRDHCSFGLDCIFGDRCSFGYLCYFGANCSFGEDTNFATVCTFGEQCRFGRECNFGDLCSFGGYCKFRDYCSFGRNCTFGEQCRFEDGCSFEKGHMARGTYPFMAFIGAGSRPGTKVYFFNCKDGIIVRCGCWCSNIESFRQRVHEQHADRLYLEFADIAEKRFNHLNK